MKKTILNLIPGIITLLFVVVILCLRDGSTPWKNIGIIEALSFVYVSVSFLISPYLMIVNYKHTTKKTAIPFFLLIVAESILLPFLACLVVLGTKYMSKDELLSIVIYILPLAFAYTVPVVIWPMLCFLKYAKRGNGICSNLMPLFLAMAFCVTAIATKLIIMAWYFAEIVCFEIRMAVLMIVLPIYGLLINKKAVIPTDLTGRFLCSAIAATGCLAIFFFTAEPQVNEKYFVYILIYEVIAFAGQWAYIKLAQKKTAK